MYRSSIAEVIAAWRKRLLSWSIRGTLPGVSAPVFREAADLAFDSWQGVCGLAFTEAGAGQMPDIVMNAGRIDAPGQVLAWSELPDGSDRQLTQMYDTSERFVVSQNPGQGQIDLVAVIAHELGHALGLDHAPQNTPDLMAPYYRPGLRVPQPGDISRIQRLYGGPTIPPIPPVPTPPVPPVPGGPIIIEIYDARMIRIPGYKVVKE